MDTYREKEEKMKEYYKIEEGDIVTHPSYCGYLIVQNIDYIPYTRPHWNCRGLDCDTCYEPYAEDELRIHLKHYNYFIEHGK